MDHPFVYRCEETSCGHEGVLDYRAEAIPGMSEPTWVPCPQCGNPMAALREAEEAEKRSLPRLTRYCRLGPIFSFRTDDPVFSVVDSSVATQRESNPQTAQSDIIFTPEAARILRTTPSRTTYLARTGVIPAFKVGKKEWRYCRKALEEWVLNQAIGSSGTPTPMPKASTPKPCLKSKAVKKSKNLPTDLSPDALKKAIQSIRSAGE